MAREIEISARADTDIRTAYGAGPPPDPTAPATEMELAALVLWPLAWRLEQTGLNDLPTTDTKGRKALGLRTDWGYIGLILSETPDILTIHRARIVWTDPPPIKAEDA